MHLRFVLASKGQSDFKWHRQELMVLQRAESNCHCPDCLLHADKPSLSGDLL